jgi:protein-tyrosine phosphatase
VNFSAITDSLYVGTAPHPEDYDTLRELGVKLVLNMRIHRWPYLDRHHPPIRNLWLPTFDFPLLPIPLKTLRRGVIAALEVLGAGDKVYTHCTGGVHRSVAMAAAILIAQGYSVQDAVQLLKDRRAAADPDAWHIRRQVKRFAKSWEKHPGV